MNCLLIEDIKLKLFKGMKKKVIEKNLKQTEVGYNLIAKKFSETRKHFWRSLDFIKQYVQDGDAILDFGCGNGRLTELFNDKKINYTGVDTSQKLIDIATKKSLSSFCDKQRGKNQFIKISPTKVSLPFNDENFNSVYSIATFHHLPGKKHRQNVTNELYRITKKEGWVVVTVWNLWQTKYKKQIWRNRFNKIIGRSELDWNDCQITFTDNEGKVFNRYHHAFTGRELERLFRKAGFNIIEIKKVGGNIVLVGQK
jgi:ubiquinone/menaquinone biosynthesis C-methylase UbiE